MTGAIQELVGVPLDGFVAVDLQGFVKLVNSVNGLWIRIPEPLYDDHYPKVDGSGYMTISFKAGCQKLSGAEALQYARSRHQDSDYGRMRRQQLTLLALRRQLDPLALLERAPEMLSIAKDDLWTTIKRKDLAGPRRARRRRPGARRRPRVLHAARVPRVPDDGRDQADPPDRAPLLRPEAARAAAAGAAATTPTA